MFSNRLIKNIIRPIYKLYEKILIRQVGGIYTRMLNLKLFLQKKPDRITVVSDGLYLLRYRSLKWYFRHEEQGNLAYQRGIEFRKSNLEKDYMLKNVNLVAGDTIIDCGANVGDFYLSVSERIQSFHYIGFEPSPHEFACLQRNVVGHQIHNVALWKDDSELTFYIDSQKANSSLIEPVNFEKPIKVKARRLCHYIEGDIKLLKLEAEGAEPEILIGLGDKLNNIEYICADLGYERGKSEETTLFEVTNLLLKNNFELIDINLNRLCCLYKRVTH
jgi:FkbM family methyltransferase